MYKKRCVLLLVFVLSIFFTNVSIHADTYKEQLDASGAESLNNLLPDNTKKSLADMNIDSFKWEDLANLRPEKIFEEIINESKRHTKKPLSTLAICIGIILLCAIADSLKDPSSLSPLNGVVNVIGSLCICVCMVIPVISVISNAGKTLVSASRFMLSYIPILAGIMAATGQTVSSLSYQLTMVCAGEFILKISSDIIVPVIYIFLALSLASSISQRLNILHIPNMIYKGIKCLLVFFVSVFITLLTIQNFVGASADSVGSKAAKAVVGTLVPVVGGAVSDAISTVYGYVKLLKSSIGAFGIVAVFFIFVPILSECLIWTASANMCSVVANVFNFKQVSLLLKGIANAVNIMIAVIVSSIIIMIVSTTVVLMVWGIVQ